MRSALDNTTLAFPYDLKSSPIEDFNKVKDGDTILVATCYFEIPSDDMKRDVVVVQEGAAEKGWEVSASLVWEERTWGRGAVTNAKFAQKLSREEKRIYIQTHFNPCPSTTPSSPPRPPKIYLTLPFHNAHSRLSSSSTLPPPSSSLDIIAQNWALPLDAILGFQGMVAPYGEVEDWDAELLAALALLSEVLAGHEMVAGEAIIGVVKRRQGGVVGVGDVVEIGRVMYRRGMYRRGL